MTDLDLTGKEIEEIFSQIIVPRVIGDTEGTLKKSATLLGGQPGSGKSTLARDLLHGHGNVVFVNGDDLRAYHPRYYEYLHEDDRDAAEKTQEVCNAWINALIRECMERDLSMLIEGTFRTTETSLSTARELYDNKYQVNIAALSVPAELSLASIEYRYTEAKKLGLPVRYTKKEAHDDAYKGVERTVQELADSGLFTNFSIYFRETDGFSRKDFSFETRREMLEAFKSGRLSELNETVERYIR